MEDFISDTSRLCWELYEKTNNIGVLMLHLNLEYASKDLYFAEDNAPERELDGGMEL